MVFSPYPHRYQPQIENLNVKPRMLSWLLYPASGEGPALVVPLPLPSPTANDHRAHQLTVRAHVSERLG